MEVRIMRSVKDFPVNPVIDRDCFISPFSRRLIENVEWQELKQTWKGMVGADRIIKDEEYELLKSLGMVEVMSGLQIARNFLAGIDDFRKNKKRLKVLSGCGVLVEHRLYVEGREPCLIYTLGPAGAKVIAKPYVLNWWVGLEAPAVMKKLIAVQLWLRLRAYDKNTTFLLSPKPYLGLIEFFGKKYLVSAGMGNSSRGKTANPIFAIGENLTEVMGFKSQIPVDMNVRFTTDYDLFTVELCRMFYTFSEAGKLVNEEVKGFKKIGLIEPIPKRKI